MVLSVKELTSLLAALGDEAKAFETTSAAFLRTFAKAEQFRIACGMQILLQVLHPHPHLLIFVVLLASIASSI